MLIKKLFIMQIIQYYISSINQLMKEEFQYERLVTFKLLNDRMCNQKFLMFPQSTV